MSTPPAGSPGGRGAKTLAGYVTEVVTAEHKRADSIEARGRSVISSAGALVTLLLALAAVGAKSKAVAIPSGAAALIAAAVLCFALAAVAAVATAAPQTAHLVEPAGFEAAIKAAWDRPKDAALKQVTATKVVELADAQRANNRKAIMLAAAVGLEALAVLLLAAAVAWTTLA